MATNYLTGVDLRTFNLKGTAFLDASVATIRNGYLVKFPAGVGTGSLLLSTGSPIGMAFDNLALESYPTDDNLVTYLSGERITFLSGEGTATCGSGLFASSAMPTAVGQKVYDNGNGLLTITAASGKQQVGTTIDIPTQLNTGQVVTGLATIYFVFNINNPTAN